MPSDPITLDENPIDTPRPVAPGFVQRHLEARYPGLSEALDLELKHRKNNARDEWWDGITNRGPKEKEKTP